MAVTIGQLAAALRITDGTAPQEPQLGILTRLLSVAEAIVGETARTAPDAVKDQATIQIAAYLYDQPSAGAGMQYAAAVRNSGALTLLSRWIPRRAAEQADSSTIPTPSPSGPGVDAEARRIANLAENTATDALNKANEALQDIAELIPLIQAKGDPYVLPAAAPGVRGGVQAVTNAIMDTGTSTGIFGWGLSHVRRMIEAIVPSWARQASPPSSGGTSLPTIPEDGHEYTLRGRDNIGAGGQNDPIQYWERTNEVPNSPGTQSGIGRVLTVTGEDDRDYAWRGLDLATAVAAYLRANPPSGTTDRTARDAIATERTERQTADTELGRRIDGNVLSQTQQLGMVKFTADPPTFVYSAAADFNRAFTVRVDEPELVEGDLWYDRAIGGFDVPGGRTKWASTTASIDFPAHASFARIAATAMTTGAFTLQLTFYNAAREGETVAAVRIPIAVVASGGGITTLKGEGSVSIPVNNQGGSRNYWASMGVVVQAGDVIAGRAEAAFNEQIFTGFTRYADLSVQRPNAFAAQDTSETFARASDGTLLGRHGRATNAPAGTANYFYVVWR